jgi:hypothetical protein
VGQRTVNWQLKRWFLDHDPADMHPELLHLEGESEDHVFAASIAAAAVLAAFVILMVVATILLAGRLVVAWFAQA